MLHYSVYHAMNTTFGQRKTKNTGRTLGTMTSSFRSDMTDASVRKLIGRLESLAGRPAVWSSFVNRDGHLIEKAVIVGQERADGVRMSDTVWINKGYARYF